MKKINNIKKLLTNINISTLTNTNTIQGVKNEINSRKRKV